MWTELPHGHHMHPWCWTQTLLHMFSGNLFHLISMGHSFWTWILKREVHGQTTVPLSAVSSLTNWLWTLSTLSYVGASGVLIQILLLEGSELLVIHCPLQWLQDKGGLRRAQWISSVPHTLSPSANVQTQPLRDPLPLSKWGPFFHAGPHSEVFERSSEQLTSLATTKDNEGSVCTQWW